MAADRKRVAIFISGRGSNMAALIEAAKADDFPAEIRFVFSNQPDAAGLAIARTAGIQTVAIDHRPFGNDREAFERAVSHKLDVQGIDIICLAGFMRLFSAAFVQRWETRMLNIHPSLLPSFPGLDPHGQALRAGVKISGATVHFVIPKTDAGPILMQAAVPVHAADTPDTLAARVLAAEHKLYPAALRLVADGRVTVANGRCEIAGTSDGQEPMQSPTLYSPPV